MIQGASVFLIASLCLVLLAVQNYENQILYFNDKIEKLTRYAASMVDMRLHLQLDSPEQTNGELYNRVLTPLVNLHNAYPEIHYLYTMIEKDDSRFFILDTANSDLLISKAGLVPSRVMDRYDDEDIEEDWLQAVRQGQVYIDQELFVDEFGTFVSGSAPLFDTQGNYAGILGIDIDAESFLTFRNQVVIDTLIAALIALALSFIVGILRYRNRKYIQNIRDLEHDLIFTDTLTGTFNRRYYDGLIQNEWNRFKRYKTRFSMAIIDIDYFKNINDTYGHDTGDLVLVEFTGQIKSGIRDTDFLIRIGGEEFLVFMPNTDELEAVNQSWRMNNRISNHVITRGDRNISITFSAGVSSVRETDVTDQDTYKRADISL